MVFMGIGAWEVVVLLAVVAIAVLVVAVLVRAATASGVRRAQREAEQAREDRQG